MSKNINHLRYWYFAGTGFYEIIGLIFTNFFTWLILWYAYPIERILNITTLDSSTNFLISENILKIILSLLYFIGIISLSIIGSLLILKTPFMITKAELAHVSKIGISTTIFQIITILFFKILIENKFENNISGVIKNLIGILILFSIIYIGVIKYKKGLVFIRIYPNRIILGDLVLYYKDMIKVQWEDEEIGSSLTEEQKKKPLKILTPILKEYGNEEFMMYFFRIVIEMPDVIYIAQSLHNRNAFVQNIKNGWLEDWRWDGSIEPPTDWVKKKKN